MLRDRVPETISLALIWCKAKERWLDHAYKSFIAIYAEKNERYNATRIVLGLKNGKIHFDFHKTIDWDNLTQDEELYWKIIENWVNWFSEHLLYVKTTYNIYSAQGCSKEEIISHIQNEHFAGYDPKRGEKLATFLYKHFSGN